ncbi:MAG: flavodoxin family protein [Deltaproteobacteria bacterium]|nr:flavodoxin family protein [Deltaproteobacteria bacterium]
MDKIVIEKRYSKADPGSIRRVLAIQGSPRKQRISKTEIVLKAFLQGCRDEGAETETIYLRKQKIKACVGCFTCWTKTPGVCVSQDDVPEILKKQAEADLSVFAFPLYHFGINSLTKKFIERTLPMLEPFLIEKEDGTTTHPLRNSPGKRRYVAILGVCGFPEVSHFAAASANFHSLAQADAERSFNIICEIYRPASELLSSPIYQPETERVLKAVRGAGSEVVRNGTVEQATIDAIARVDLDPSAIREMSNKVWEYCIREGKTLPEFQKEMMKT